MGIRTIPMDMEPLCATAMYITSFRFSICRKIFFIQNDAVCICVPFPPPRLWRAPLPNSQGGFASSTLRLPGRKTL